MQRIPKHLAAAGTVAVAALALSLPGAMAAGSHDGHGRDDGGRARDTRGDDGRKNDEHMQARFAASLAPSVPADLPIHGVAAGSAPWALDRGRVQLKADGRIRVRVEGLVIPIAHGGLPAGTARPVTTVSASLYCAPEASAAAATTKSAPISEGGDATIADTITLPATCLAPVVLVHPNGTNGAYIAASGWRS